MVCTSYGLKLSLSFCSTAEHILFIEQLLELLAVPERKGLVALDLLLQLQNAIEKSLSSWWAA
jgi:hypothetical protein